MARAKKIKQESNVAIIEKEPQQQIEEVEIVEPATNKVETILMSPPSQKEQNKAKLAKFIEMETKTVKGRFRNYETPGGMQRIMIRKYPGIPAFDKMMYDNEIYEIPIYVARHLNGVDITAGGGNTKINTCAYPTHGFIWEKDRNAPASKLNDAGIPVPIIGVEKWNRRFGFDSMEFDTEK